MTRLTCIDLFAGAGGLSEGLSQAGFTCLYANELEPTYATTFALNHPETMVESGDIRTVDPAEVRVALRLQVGELSLLAGGPPCQGFSINAPVRSAEDQRNHLFRDFLRFVDEFQPEAVLIENVPGMVSFSGGETLEAILLALRELGYEADVRILYAPHFGVPQTRWRTVIIGLRDGSPADAFPQPAFEAPVRVNFTAQWRARSLVHLPNAEGLRSFTTIQDAIGDLPSLQNGEAGPSLKEYASAPATWYAELLREGSPGVLNHEAQSLSPTNLARLRHIPPGGNWTDIPRHMLPEGMKKARLSDHTKRYGRALPDGLASTILTKCDPHWGAFFHYSEDRAFTVREAARLQSFPDRFRFSGSKVAQFAQVGNAVPPLLGRAVGLAIAEVIGIAARARKAS